MIWLVSLVSGVWLACAGYLLGELWAKQGAYLSKVLGSIVFVVLVLLSSPLVSWLNDHYGPDVPVPVTPTPAQAWIVPAVCGVVAFVVHLVRSRHRLRDGH